MFLYEQLQRQPVVIIPVMHELFPPTVVELLTRMQMSQDRLLRITFACAPVTFQYFCPAQSEFEVATEESVGVQEQRLNLTLSDGPDHFYSFVIKVAKLDVQKAFPGNAQCLIRWAPKDLVIE